MASGMQHASQSLSNNSPSKSLYSFTKAQRFPTPTRPYCDNSFYDVSNTLSRRGTSLGYGTRFAHLINKSVAPGPQAYSLPSTKAPQSFTFGISRDKFEKVYIKENPPIDKNLPGPGKYTINSRMLEKQVAPSYSLRPNTSYQSMFVDPTKKYPGPGQYDVARATENRNGYILFSKYKSSGAVVISRAKERFDHRDTRRSIEVPGPGQYQLNLNMKYQNQGSTVFGTGRRSSLANEKQSQKTPGPGTYRIRGDFGYYDDSDQIYVGGQSKLSTTRNQF